MESSACAIPVQIALVALDGEVLDCREGTLEPCRGAEMTFLDAGVHPDPAHSRGDAHPLGRRGVVGFIRFESNGLGSCAKADSVGLSMQIVDLSTGRTSGFWGSHAPA